MRGYAGLAMGTASAFLAIMAILIGSTALFYITTALIAILITCRLQARLAVRRLRLIRIAPESAQVGEMVTVEIEHWSEVKMPRPLITVQDGLPPKLLIADRSPSLPIAPAFDMPIRTQYRFRPQRRGRYRWNRLIVEGTDALGLVTFRQVYETSPAEILVLPRPIPVVIDLPTAAGWGITEAESGRTRGAGLEPWGIRPYTYGDSLRQVHWRSTARTGNLMVKEFEAGSQAAAAFVFQRTQGSEIGEGVFTTLEVMCGHIAFLAETFLNQGAHVTLPGLEDYSVARNSSERIEEIYQTLALVQADRTTTVSDELIGLVGTLPPGSVIFVLVSVIDDLLPDTVARLAAYQMRVVPLLYDTLVFQPKTDKQAPRNSVDSNYVEALRAAGGTPVVVPISAQVRSIGGDN